MLKNQKSRVSGRGGIHGRTMNFFDAAARRLAWHDYERVSVAMICRDARSTPYTFYRRFPNKRAFHYALVLVAFRLRTSKFNERMREFGKELTAGEIIDRIVDEIIAGTVTVSGIGVTQLAIRIVMSKREAGEPYLAYRQAVTDTAVELLSPKINGDAAELRIESVVQMLFATATDEAWRHGIPFATARKRELAKEYGRVMRSSLGLSADSSRAGQMRTAILPYQPFPEEMRTALPVSKRALRSYEKEVNSSRKPEFRLTDPVDPLDVLIAATREENRKTEKPIRKQLRPTRPKSRRKARFRIV